MRHAPFGLDALLLTASMHTPSAPDGVVARVRSLVWRSTSALASSWGVRKAPGFGRAPRERIDEWYREFGASMLGFARRHLPPERADELVHDVFVSLVHLDAIPPANPRAWLFTVLRRRLIDVYRAAARSREVAVDVHEEPDPCDPVERLHARFELQRVAVAIDQCCDPLEQEILMRWWEGQTSREIGVALELNPDCVRQKKRRAWLAVLAHCD